MSHHGCPERLSNRSKGFQEDGAGQTTMEVLVETLTGTAFEMTVSPSDTVFAIKSKICRVEGIPVSQQHLVYNLRELEDCASLGALGIADGARLRLVLGMRGGPVSSRRLPPPPEPWPRADSRDDSDWGGRCRVTVVVFRDGERLNMLRVTENPDGSYSPIDHNYSSPVPSSVVTPELGAGSLAQNAVTMGKMQDIRRRMESLYIQRKHHAAVGAGAARAWSDDSLRPHTPPHDHTPPTPAAAVHDHDHDHYTRYEYSCVDRYTLLPPLGAPAPAPPSADRLQMGSARAGSILVSGGGDADDELLLAPAAPAPRPRHPPLSLECGTTPCSHQRRGPVLTGWRAMFGPTGTTPQGARPDGPGRPLPGAGRPVLAGTTGRGPAHARSASSLLRGVLPAPAPATLQDAVFSSSTSDLEQLRRNRLLPALCRHRNTEHLHLSDGMLHKDASRRRIDDIAELERAADEERSDKKEKEKKPRLRCVVCRKKLCVSTAHVCACGTTTCPPHRYPDAHACPRPPHAPHTPHTPHTHSPAPTPRPAPRLPKI